MDDFEPFGKEWQKEMKRLDKDDLIDLLRKSLIKDKCLEKFKNLYVKVNEMLMYMGINGEISTRNERTVDVMEALFKLDGGVYDVTKVS